MTFKLAVSCRLGRIILSFIFFFLARNFRVSELKSLSCYSHLNIIIPLKKYRVIAKIRCEIESCEDALQLKKNLKERRQMMLGGRLVKNITSFSTMAGNIIFKIMKNIKRTR